MRKKKSRKSFENESKKIKKSKNATNEKLKNVAISKNKSTKKRDEEARKFFSKNSKIFDNRQNRNIETINNNRYKFNKIIFCRFENYKIYKINERIKQSNEITNFIKVNEIFVNLSKYRKILFLSRNFNFHNKKSRNNNNFRFFDEKLDDNFEKTKSYQKTNFRQ